VTEGVVLGVGHRPWNPRHTQPLELALGRLSDLTSRELDLADYEVFPKAALEGDDREFYAARAALAGNGGVEVFESRAFRRRGPGLLVLAHPWRLYHQRGAKPGALRVLWSRRGRRRLLGNLSGRVRRDRVLSLDLTLTPEQAAECQLAIDGVAVPIHPYQKDGTRARYMTRRFVTTRRSTPVRIGCPRRELFEPEPTVEALQWVLERPVATAD